MNINVGDIVQIKNGAIDVTNGYAAKAGVLYGEGGPLRAIVELIDPEWATGGRWNLPPVITKVRCKAKDGTIVWQVQPQDISSNIIRSGVEVLSEAPPLPTILSPTDAGKVALNNSESEEIKSAPISTAMYTTKPNAQSWVGGIPTTPVTTGKIIDTPQVKIQVGSGTAIGNSNVFKY